MKARIGVCNNSEGFGDKKQKSICYDADFLFSMKSGVALCVAQLHFFCMREVNADGLF